MLPAIGRKSGLPPVIEAMMKPEFYPHPAGDVELKQTHISYVLLAGEFAYKVRKAVRFAFIDCSTAARRRLLCARELELNRRLSPDVYLGVVAIVHSGGWFALDESADSADAIEFAVKMRRLPEDRRLDLIIARGAATAEDILSIAATVGKFHASAPNTNSWAYGAAANIWRMTIANIVEIEQLQPDALLLTKIAQIEAYSRRYIAAHWEFLNSRAREGRIREGHGDLRADAVYFTSGGIRIIDCLEFDERLRYGDIANELAFLAMDLERLGRPDLSQALVGNFAYDTDFAVLLPFYKSYRATVRAKVELLRIRHEDGSVEEKNGAAGNALRLLDLALSHVGQPKALLIVCGVSGTGKSTFATTLSEHLGFETFNSDLERKRLAGLESTAQAAAGYNQGIYSAEFTARVYNSLLAEAKRVLHSGRGVILDATFSKRRQRELAVGLANQAGVEPLFLECRAGRNEVIQRLSRRHKDSLRVSDVTAEIYLAQLKDFEQLDEIPPAWHQVIDTARDLAPIVTEVERRVYSAHYSRR